jgi:hypothetical protein
MVAANHEHGTPAMSKIRITTPDIPALAAQCELERAAAEALFWRQKAQSLAGEIVRMHDAALEDGGRIEIGDGTRTAMLYGQGAHDATQRWETGFRNIASILGYSRKPFDIPDIVEEVRRMREREDALRSERDPEPPSE